MSSGLTKAQLDRYSRHVIMDDVGPDGQQALLEGSVLVVGAGGLGSPVIQYLAAAGVGTIGIADDDVVERSNLQRQVIHGSDDVGRSKVQSAADSVQSLNPDVTVEQHDVRVTAENVRSLVEGYDVVVDATDNFQSRYVLNDACVFLDKPVVYGAVYQFEGQVSTFEQGGEEPCYRCLFPEAPPAGAVPNCATAGVLGVLPGTIGAMQATEAVKRLIGHGETLSGRLLTYDATSMAVETVPIRRNPDCPVCGDDPVAESIAELAYTDRYGIDPAETGSADR